MNTLAFVKHGGAVVTAAGSIDKLTVAGGTACRFGKTSLDGDILHFVTTRGMSAPANGTEVEDGKVAGRWLPLTNEVCSLITMILLATLAIHCSQQYN